MLFQILDKGDFMMLQGKPFIKKSGEPHFKEFQEDYMQVCVILCNRICYFVGWRKIAFFFNVSFEIRDRKIQFDESNNVQRAEFVIRANMQ